MGDLAPSPNPLNRSILHVFRTSTAKETNRPFLIFLSDSTNTSPFSRSMQGQKTTNGYSVAGQRTQSYGYTASRRRPPAIPVRSRVANGQAIRSQPLVTAQRLLAGMSIFNYYGQSERIFLYIFSFS